MTQPSRARRGETWSVSGTSLPDGARRQWWVEDGLLHAEPVADAEPLPGRFFLAGLVDAHCHLSLETGPHGPLPLDAARRRRTCAP